MSSENTLPPPYEERQLPPEDYLNVVEMVSWVNKVALAHYPEITLLSIGQVIFVTDIADVERQSAETSLHPFFLEKVKDKVSFSGAPGLSWINPSENCIFFSWQCIEDMRKNKVVGYLGMGMDMIDAIIALGTKPAIVDQDAAAVMAKHTLMTNHQTTLQGIFDENDLEEAIAYVREKDPHIVIRGLEMRLMVEDKMFLPSTGMTSNSIFVNYFAKPIKTDYGRMVADEFNLSPFQRGTIQQFVDNSNRLGLSMAKSPKQMERDLIERAGMLGYRGRSNLLRAYQNGDIGIKTLQQHLRTDSR